MRGQVYVINHKLEWAAVLTEDQYFSLVEIAGMPVPNLGDFVSGDLKSHRQKMDTFNNVTQGKNFNGLVQEMYADLKSVKRALHWSEDREYCKSL